MRLSPQALLEVRAQIGPNGLRVDSYLGKPALDECRELIRLIDEAIAEYTDPSTTDRTPTADIVSDQIRFGGYVRGAGLELAMDRGVRAGRDRLLQ
jgi:hypothetical protein